VILLAAIIVWTAATGCAARFKSPGRSTPRAVADGACLGAHLEAIEQRNQGAGMAGSGRVHFYSDAGRGRASFDFIFRRPDFLRLQFLSPLGPAAAVLELDGECWLFADYREGVYIHGGSGTDEFHRLTGLPSDPRTLISILFAELLPADPGVDRLLFSADTCLPLSCELPGGSPASPPVTVEYVWPAAVTAPGEGARELLLPERICFHGPETHQLTVIRIKEAHQLTLAEQTRLPEPLDISGLRQAVPDVDDAGVPGWLR
jgi:hypothetical protein